MRFLARAIPYGKIRMFYGSSCHVIFVGMRTVSRAMIAIGNCKTCPKQSTCLLTAAAEESARADQGDYQSVTRGGRKKERNKK